MPCTPHSQRCRPPPGSARPDPERAGASPPRMPYIRASTDLGNVPMAAAFHRAGWVTTGHQIDMTWERPG